MCIRLFFTISRLIISSGRPEERRRKEGDFVFPVEWKGNRVTLPTIYARNKICLYYRFCCCSYKDIRKCINSYMLPRLAGFFLLFPQENQRRDGERKETSFSLWNGKGTEPQSHAQHYYVIYMLGNS